MYQLPHKFSLLPRKKNTDKNAYGHALIVAGSRGMTGAALLASRAALESGSGLVTLGIPQSLIPIAAKALPEVMQLGLPETKEASPSFSAYFKIIKFMDKRRIDGLLVGPGLSQNNEAARLVRKLISAVAMTTVLDADGINSFSAKGGSAFGGKGYLRALQKHRSRLILTPHRKEFERLFSVKLPDQKSDRIKLAKRLSKFYDVVLVIKSHRTLVVSGDRCYVNTTGNPGMAKGGAGDVLAGMITAFVCQKLDPFLASSWAVYFHGRAADLAVKKRGELGLTASELIQFLPKAFKR